MKLRQEDRQQRRFELAEAYQADGILAKQADLVTLEITDIYELSRVLNRIEQLPNVYEARRYRK